MLHACMKLYRSLAMNRTTEDVEQQRLSRPNHVSINMTSSELWCLIQVKLNGAVGDPSPFPRKQIGDPHWIH